MRNLTPATITQAFADYCKNAPSERTRALRTEGPTPLPNRLVGDGDAPLGEEIFSISEAQTEPVVEPDGVTDDFRRESVAVVAGGRLVIGLLCQAQPQLDNTRRRRRSCVHSIGSDLMKLRQFVAADN